MRYRLAALLGRTVAELEDSLTYEEWRGWIAFQSLYDLPDGFFVVGQLGAIVASAVSGKRTAPGEIVPYYRAAENPTVNESLAAAFRFLSAHAPHAEVPSQPASPRP